MNEFKTAYRLARCAHDDDIQFFAGKDRSQEEFFHTFNELLEGQHQVILTCDRYPKASRTVSRNASCRRFWLESRLDGSQLIRDRPTEEHHGRMAIDLPAQHFDPREEFALP